MKAVVAFSVITNLRMDFFEALLDTATRQSVAIEVICQAYQRILFENLFYWFCGLDTLSSWSTFTLWWNEAETGNFNILILNTHRHG